MKLFFCLLAFCCVLEINAQNYLINFAGSGASTTVSTVKVENLMSGTILTLNGADVLRLTSLTNINDVENKRPVDLMIYPNPNDGDAIVKICPPIEGPGYIKVFDMSGILVAQFQKNLDRTSYEFKLIGISKGLYLVQVSGSNYQYSGKLLSNGNHPGKISIEDIAIHSLNFEQKPQFMLKSTFGSTIDMLYTNGDRLKFTGSSGIYSTVIVDIPTESKTIAFNFIPCSDGDNNNYPIVEINNQIWMTENLKTTRYSNGDLIGTTSSATFDISGETAPTYQWPYDGNEINVSTYGRLYTWYAATDSRKACPVDWHVPSEDEWLSLRTYLDGIGNAGGMLKEIGNSHWKFYSGTGGTDEEGFKALPGGVRSYFGPFTQITESGFWWSSTEPTTTDGYNLFMYYYNKFLQGNGADKKHGMSIRCIKDQPKNEEAFPGIDGELRQVILDGDTIDCRLIDTIYVFQGDIILRKDQISNAKGNATSIFSKRWTEGIVYYEINDNLPEQMKEYIISAIGNYEDKTNLRFVKRSNQTNYVEFVNSESLEGLLLGTCSEFGMIGGKQRIWLEPSWNQTGEVIHEIGHTVGLEHEHSRIDRDNYITIIWDNIKLLKQSDYGIIKKSFYSGDFDFGSIMLYGSYSNNARNPLLPVIVKNSTGTGFIANREELSPGDIEMINTLYKIPGPVIDIEGNTYKTIQIGTQIWMAENLKVTKYNDGTIVPIVTNGLNWHNLTTPAYCWYNNDEGKYKPEYGALYNWYTVSTGKLCPTGWHVPTDIEWTILTDFLGGLAISGGKLKESGIVHWYSPNTGATNETGFTALPGSNFDADFLNNIGEYGCWWTSTSLSSLEAYYRALHYSYNETFRDTSRKVFGFSVRCLKDN